MAGEIISERRATSNRNGGRHHRGFASDFPRIPQSRADSGVRGRAPRHDLARPRKQSTRLAGAIHLGGNLFERSIDDVDAPSLLPVILAKGLGRTACNGLAVRAGERINGWHNFRVEELIRVEITP